MTTYKVTFDIDLSAEEESIVREIIRETEADITRGGYPLKDPPADVAIVLALVAKSQLQHELDFLVREQR